MDEDVARFMAAIKGDRFESLFTVALFSGMRQSEIIGLRWDDVDLENGLINVCRQLQKSRSTGEYIYIDETKNGKNRIAAIAPSIVKVLRKQKLQQMEWQLAAGPLWNNPNNLVFTDELGNHIRHNTVVYHFKDIVSSLGLENVRFHDLRHSYAINALQAGDDVKTVQEQLGHYSSAFTLDVYAAVSGTMRKESQARMESLIKSVSDL
jgi:integrase